MALFTKEAVAIVLDVGRSMGKMHGNKSGLEKAKSALRQMIQQKLLFTKQDEMGVVLVGTAKTSNELNTEQGGYEHITVKQEIAKPNLEMLEMVDSIDTENAQADVIDGLLVAMQIIKARVKKLKFAKRIFLITDAAGAIADDPDQIDTIAGVMTGDDIKLNIIGIGFESGEADGDDEDGPKVKAEPGVKKEGAAAAAADQKDHKSGVKPPPAAAAGSSASAAAAAGAPVRTAAQKKNELFLRSFAEKVNGAVFNVQNALEMLSFFRSRSVRQVTKYRGTLEISKHIAIQVYTYGKTSVQNLPSLTKMSIPASESDDAGACKVNIDRTYIDKERDNKAIDPEHRTKSFKYGKQNVPFAAADLLDLKYKSEKEMKTLGFAAAKTIYRHHSMATVDVVVPEPGNENSAKALSALIHALHETEMVGIVRYVARKDSVPKLGYIFPHITASAEFLYFNKLPYAEDIREYPFASLDAVKQFQPNKNQLGAARDLINSMDLMTASVDDDGKPMEALKPKFTFNPVLQRFYQCVEKRALDKTAKLDELDPMIAAYINPDKSILSRSDGAFKRIELSADLQEAKKKLKLTDTKEGAAAAAAAGGAGSSSAAAAAGAGGGGAVKFDDITRRLVDRISTVSPVEDFRAMLARRDDARIATRAINELTEVIKNLVKESFGDANFGKALDCLVALRIGCIQMEECKLFNDSALSALQSAFAKKKENFWKLVASRPVLPIDSSEVATSNVTPEAARKYHSASASQAAPSVSVSVSASNELFDEMA